MHTPSMSVKKYNAWAMPDPTINSIADRGNPLSIIRKREYGRSIRFAIHNPFQRTGKLPDAFLAKKFHRACVKADSKTNKNTKSFTVIRRYYQRGQTRTIGM